MIGRENNPVDLGKENGMKILSYFTFCFLCLVSTQTVSAVSCGQQLYDQMEACGDEYWFWEFDELSDCYDRAIENHNYCLNPPKRVTGPEG